MMLEKFWEFFGKEMLYLKFKITMKPYFHLYLTLLSRQLDNDDADDDENDIDIFSLTDKHGTYEIPQRKQFAHHKSRSTQRAVLQKSCSTVGILL